MNSITLSAEEAQSVYRLIDELSGGNAGNCFAWDGTDDPGDPTTMALAKIFVAAGKGIPSNLVRQPGFNARIS